MMIFMVLTTACRLIAVEGKRQPYLTVTEDLVGRGRGILLAFVVFRFTLRSTMDERTSKNL